MFGTFFQNSFKIMLIVMHGKQYCGKGANASGGKEFQILIMSMSILEV
jgi:hypothetical protein